MIEKLFSSYPLLFPTMQVGKLKRVCSKLASFLFWTPGLLMRSSNCSLSLCTFLNNSEFCLLVFVKLCLKLEVAVKKDRTDTDRIKTKILVSKIGIFGYFLVKVTKVREQLNFQDLTGCRPSFILIWKIWTSLGEKMTKHEIK